VAGNIILKAFYLLGAEFDNPAACDVDQMIPLLV